ncbi:MAG: sugar ABC transporter permease, partial [Aeriscardovia aeriphila]|nr:sugar ABC transporter permease [Aeriscardovia aeriphila]
MSSATAAPAKKQEKNETVSVLRSVANNARQYGIVGALLVIVIVFEILTRGVLLKPNSFVSLIQQNAYVIILAIGMVMVIIATHIDLSVGSLVAFIGGVCALLMERAGVNWGLAIVISLLVGLVIGCWQGFWVAYVGIPGFITTLAGMLMFRGLATVIVGESVPITSNEFRGIARNYLPNILGFWGQFDGLTIVLGLICIAALVFTQLRKRARIVKVGLVPEPMALTVIKLVIFSIAIIFVTYLLASSGNDTQGGTPIMLVIVAVLVLVYNFILTRTVFGRHVYAVGGNRKAAILSGINTKRV